MPRYEVIESKVWKRDDGRTASIYGAVPWTSPSEEKRWKIEPRGYTVRNTESGTVGVGRQPWKTRAEAQAWADKENERLAELAAARGSWSPPARSSTKRPRSSHARRPPPCLEVYFRVFDEGDVIALFPEDSAGGGLINSYQRHGQHGPASRNLIKKLRAATEKEYKPLLAELQRIGYCLRVRA